MHCCRTRGVTYCFCRCWSTTLSRTWTNTTLCNRGKSNTKGNRVGGNKKKKSQLWVWAVLPVVFPLHTSWGRSLRTQSTPLSHCQGFHSCGWEQKQMVDCFYSSSNYISFWWAWPQQCTHRSNSLVMMRNAHFLHFHHASSGRSSSSTSSVSWNAQAQRKDSL